MTAAESGGRVEALAQETPIKGRRGRIPPGIKQTREMFEAELLKLRDHYVALAYKQADDDEPMESRKSRLIAEALDYKRAMVGLTGTYYEVIDT